MTSQVNPNVAAEFVDEFLRRLMIPDPNAARRYVAPDLQIRFTAGQVMRDRDGCAAFNATRYLKVQKHVDHTEAAAGGSHEQTVVYSRGTLHGEWLIDRCGLRGANYRDAR